MIVFSIRDLYKKMGRKQVLNGVNLAVEKGEVLGLVGKSGAGKTILIKIIIGFLKQDKGEIKINSKSEHPIGYSMQENAIYENLTVLQNLRYFASINRIGWLTRRRRIKELIKSMDLGEYRRKLVKNISGGTKKRVDLACALLGDPDIIVLDEPLLGLDPGLVDSILKIIKRIEKQGKTVIISSHQIAELSRVCSRFVLLKDGILYKIKQRQLETVYR